MAEKRVPLEDREPDTARVYERAKPQKEAGLGRLDSPATTPQKRPDQVEAAVTQAHASHQLNADETVNERASEDPARPREGVGPTKETNMPVRTAEARWHGGLKDGHGSVKLGSGAFEGSYSFGTRFETQPGTNPEELIGAAHAGCFSMALAATLGKAGFAPQRVDTKASVSLEKVSEGFKITRILLDTSAEVPKIDEPAFRRYAEEAKDNCPVSQALAGVPIELRARLTQ
jgi:lipoyl-dependent peroxiredoxin